MRAYSFRIFCFLSFCFIYLIFSCFLKSTYIEEEHDSRISSCSSMILEKDESEMDFYIKELLKKNIKIEKILDPDKRKVTFLVKNNPNYSSIFSLVPRFNALLFIFDVYQQGEINLKKLKQAAQLAENNMNFIGFIYKHPKIWERNVEEVKNLVHALTLCNNLKNGTITDFTYHFSSFSSSKEKNIVQDALLYNSHYLKRICISSYFDVIGQEIIKNLKDSHSIESAQFNLGENYFDIGGIKSISDLIISDFSLTSLKLKIPISDLFFYNISDALKNPSIFLNKLKIISCVQKSISETALENFFHAIGLNKSLKVLQLGWNFSALEGLQTLGDALEVNTTLTTLALPQCNMNDKSIINISNGLKNNFSLTEIDISRNTITDLGADTILDILNSNNTLRMIHLGESYIFQSKDGSSRYAPGFNAISSSKREEIRQILQRRQGFNLSAEYCIMPTESMISVSDIDPHTELDLDASEDIFYSSSSSSAIPDSHMGPDDIP